MMMMVMVVVVVVARHTRSRGFGVRRPVYRASPLLGGTTDARVPPRVRGRRNGMGWLGMAGGVGSLALQALGVCEAPLD